MRTWTSPAPVPLMPELTLLQGADLTPLWQAGVQRNGWEDSPYWAFPWPGGVALARHLLDHPELVRGRNVFDFASGSGLVAIAAARAGAARVMAADRDPSARAVIPLNAQLNQVSVAVYAGDVVGDRLAGFDLLLAGDVFYTQELAKTAFAWFRDLARGGMTVLAGDPGRLYSPRTGTTDLGYYDVPSSVEIESRPMMRTWVLQVLP